MTVSRTYRSELRDQQAERTRELIAAAARARFLEAGWSGTSVRSVAERAGVSEATVYHVFGSKAGLAGSLIEAAERGAEVLRMQSELRERTGDPVGQLEAFVGFDRRLYEVGGDVIRVVAEARRQHPDLGAAYEQGRARGEAGRTQLFESWPREVWRAGMDPHQALDTYALVVSLAAYQVATAERGWSAARLERWWHQTLVGLLLV